MPRPKGEAPARRAAPTMTALDDDVARASAALGFELRPPQREAVAELLAGRDVLVVMPTGSGKSAIYQAAGYLLAGSTIVVSPLLALQADQAAAVSSSLGGAAALNSLCSARERRALLERAHRGELEFVLVSPELLADADVLDALAATGPSLLAVDEAHCVAMWGHDFRPDYLHLAAARARLGGPPVLALTASASPPVRAEVCERLGLRAPHTVLTGFERPALHLAVERVVARRDAEAAAVDRAVGERGRGLLYVSRRADAEGLAQRLRDRGRAAEAYHGGLGRRRRDEVLARFRDDPDLNVVATNAFGMGIDVPDVRFVLHVEPPESLDAYYQEVGRGGRDGDAAMAVCWTQVGRRSRRREHTGGADLEAAAAIHHAIRNGTETVAALPEATGLGRHRITAALAELEAVGAVRRVRRRLRAGGDEPDLDELAARAEARRAATKGRETMLQRYLDDDRCRWHQLLAYFGQPSPPSCGHCDVCDRRATEGTGTAPEHRAQVGGLAVDTAVQHEHFGAGVVVDLDAAAGTVTVLFDRSGHRILDATVALAGPLSVQGPVGPGPAAG